VGRVLTACDVSTAPEKCICRIVAAGFGNLTNHDRSTLKFFKVLPLITLKALKSLGLPVVVSGNQVYVKQHVFYRA
jgi:hypothetical protein